VIDPRVFRGSEMNLEIVDEKLIYFIVSSTMGFLVKVTPEF
jgi:hypothetical protein